MQPQYVYAIFARVTQSFKNKQKSLFSFHQQKLNHYKVQQFQTYKKHAQLLK